MSKETDMQMEIQEQRRIEALTAYRDTLTDLSTDVPADAPARQEWVEELAELDVAISVRKEALNKKAGNATDGR